MVLLLRKRRGGGALGPPGENGCGVGGGYNYRVMYDWCIYELSGKHFPLKSGRGSVTVGARQHCVYEVSCAS